MIIGKQYINAGKHWTPITSIEDDAVVMVSDRALYNAKNFAVVRSPEFDDDLGTVSWGHAVCYDISLERALEIFKTR